MLATSKHVLFPGHYHLLTTRTNVLNMFIDIQTSKELIQMDINKMMTYEVFTMDDEKLTLVLMTWHFDYQ